METAENAAGNDKNIQDETTQPEQDEMQGDETTEAVQDEATEVPKETTQAKTVGNENKLEIGENFNKNQSSDGKNTLFTKMVNSIIM